MTEKNYPEYRFQEIEPKWQEDWLTKQLYRTVDPRDWKGEKNKKFYGLVEFPYPSGEGLHMGHPRPYTAMDIIARKRRMEGYHVMFPMGWDAFGLPTENYAIKTHTHPRVITEKNVANFTRQLQRLGFSFDWERAVNTTDPHYYKWTQWIFLQLFKKGLAYKDYIAINWCLNCKIGLANEEVVQGKCERCGGPVERRMKSQWMLRITAYADRLLSDLDTVNYWNKIKVQQTDWIGKSTGVEFVMKLMHGGQDNMSDVLKVFTTRIDTVYGMTFCVIAPEHPLATRLTTHKQEEEVRAYIDASRKKSELERTAETKDKTGVFTGSYAVNPFNDAKVPVYIADFVLAHYGTGAVMAVPAHDERDFSFAEKYGLDILEVIKDKEGSSTIENGAYTSDGVLVESDQYTGMTSVEAREKMANWLEQQGDGTRVVHFKLRDWVFSRQRYWGEPIPLVYCDACKLGLEEDKEQMKAAELHKKYSEGELSNPGWIATDESALPVLLPDVTKYEPTDTGESPLSLMKDWVTVDCPKCGKNAKRETDTMPNWAGSSWYFLRYIDPKNEHALADPEKLKYWMAVDWYNGGMEHTTLHLLYSRFWNKFLFDIEAVPVSEPYQKRTSHGLILAADGEKMSKSKGNGVNPDDVVQKYGADTLRLYQMFIGPFDQPVPWDNQGLEGCHRFITRLWKLTHEKVDAKAKDDADLLRILHKTIRKVGEDIERLGFNTAVSASMILLNELSAREKISKETMEKFLIILSPFIPHVTEELWQILGHDKENIVSQPWPMFDAALAKDEEIELVVQINGKVRGRLFVSPDIGEKEALLLAHEDEIIQKWLEGKSIVKEIFVPGKIINIVVK